MAATFTNRYQKNIKGNLIQVGNTLGLSKASGTLTPGALGAIGAFISTNTANQLAGWPSGTTSLFSQNSSAAILTLPAGVTVDYAELIWSASYVVPGSDVTANIGNSITFIDAKGNVNTISATGVNLTGIALSENGENSTNYVKSADVTSIVANAGSGVYTCGNVPAALSATSNSVTYAGWSLYVVYKASFEPVRNIVLFVGQTVSIDVPYSVPINYPGPPFPIRAFYTVGEGDAIITADQFNTRPGTGVNSVNIGTTAQPANSNPFASIIGDQNGGIDTSGTFGTFNPSGVSATNINGGRQGWDIANNINITSAFTGGAVPSLGLDIGTNSDPAILLANAFVVDLSQPITSLTKRVDKTVARGGDSLQYTLVYKFTTVPMTVANIIVVDTVPTGTTYEAGSVSINGASNPALNPNPPGINLGGISGVTTFTITYRATVNNVVNMTTIPNQGFGSYQFNSNGTNFTNESTSNEVITVIDPFNAKSYKSSSLKYANIGDRITYTITIPNSGITLTNVVLKDTIPNGTSLVNNSVYINSQLITGGNPAPPSGLSVGTIPINSITTINFDVIVTTIPSPNPIPNNASISTNYTFYPTLPNGATEGLNTNTVNVQVNNITLNSTKQVSKAFANIGDILTYTILVGSTGNTVANNVVFIDTIPEGSSLIGNTLSINGVPQNLNPNPPGFTIPSGILPNTTTTIVFKVKVTDTIPTINPLKNSGSISYNYTVDPSIPNGINRGSNTNIVSTQINSAYLKNTTKSVDKVFATCGDKLIYTIIIPNEGNATAQNIIFRDTIPSGTKFIDNSVTINNVPQIGFNPGSGITIPNIAPGSSVTINFSVEVVC